MTQDQVPTWGAARPTTSLQPLFTVLEYNTVVQPPSSFLNYFSPLYLLRKEIRTKDITDFFYIVHSF